MKKVFNDSMFRDTMDDKANGAMNEAITEDVVEQVSHDEYIRQRNRMIKFMYKHDFDKEELAETYKLTVEDIETILNQD